MNTLHKTEDTPNERNIIHTVYTCLIYTYFRMGPGNFDISFSRHDPLIYSCS